MDERLKLTVTIWGNASTLFEGGLDLDEELVCGLDIVEDWTNVNDDLTEGQIAILEKASSENIVKYSKYDKKDLAVSDTNWEGQDLSIEFHLPIYLDLEALKNTIPQEG